MHNQNLIPASESGKVEFKTSFNEDVIITLVAFSNTKGGVVYIGVEDTGEVRGIQLGKESTVQWVNEVKNKTAPSVIPDIEILTVDNKQLVAMNVTEYPVKPVSTRGRYYKRVGNSNHLLSVSEVVNMHLQTVNSSWDFYLRPEKTIDDISFEKLQKVINTIARRNPDNHIELPLEFLKKYELTKGDAITNACFLMFCRNKNLYTTIQMGYFASETDIKDDYTTSDDILSQVDEVMSFIVKHINKEIIVTEKVENIQRWQYPLEAIRELVLNMIIHRDYTSPADSLIKIFQDHIVLFNPGTLPNNISVEQLLSNDYVSSPRNRQIAQIVKEIGWIEKYGTGIKRVRKLLSENDLPEPEFKLIQDGFFVKIKGKPLTDLKNVTNVTDNVTDNVTENVTENRQKVIIALLKQSPDISTSSLAKQLNVARRTIARDIDNLKQKGLLYRIGPAKGGYWQITKSEK